MEYKKTTSPYLLTIPQLEIKIFFNHFNVFFLAIFNSNPLIITKIIKFTTDKIYIQRSNGHTYQLLYLSTINSKYFF